jgi:hypothetical protein
MFRMKAGCTGRERGGHVGHCRQRVVVDRDGGGAVGRLVGRGGRDHRHRLADEARAVGRERRPASGGETGRLEARRHRCDLAREIAAGEDQSHARNAAGRLRVDRPHDRMGVGAAHEGRVEQPGEREVVEEASLPGQEPGILQALDVGA